MIDFSPGSTVAAQLSDLAVPRVAPGLASNVLLNFLNAPRWRSVLLQTIFDGGWLITESTSAPAPERRLP